eukprot:g2656.t1
MRKSDAMWRNAALVIGGLVVGAGVVSVWITRKKNVVKKNVLETIGETPLLKLNPERLGYKEVKATILAKLEFFNPGGSVKDRIAVSMIDEAEKKGQIRPGITTLVEATSGNTGIALAMVAASRGYRLVVTMPRVQAVMERYLLIRALGAEVRLSDPELKSQGFLDLAKRIAKETPNAYLLSQFTNESNPNAHYENTGPELWKQTNGSIDAFVAGAGTGGTVAGVGKYLKSKKSSCQIVCVEPAESRVLQGSKHRVHALLGIGTGLQVPMIESLAPGQKFEPGSRGVIDRFVSCSSSDGLDMCLKLGTTHGLLAGPTSGAAVRAALDYATSLPDQGRNRVIVALLASSSVRYLQHPLYETLRREAEVALASEENADEVMKKHHESTKRRNELIKDKKSTTRTKQEKMLRLAKDVETRILNHVRKLLDDPELESSHNLVDRGADSLTAMMLLGQLRQVLKGVTSDLSDLKLAILRERLWGSVRDLALGVLGIDEYGQILPRDNGKEETKVENEVLIIQYCGG